MKIALAFWGLTRSLKHTIQSIKQCIFHPLRSANIEYIIFVHTFTLSGTYTNPRAMEFNIELDFEEYKLLNPDFVSIENQDEVKQQIRVEEYRFKPDPWKTNYKTVDNFLLAMYSKSKLYAMLQTSKHTFDYIVFLRPDVLYKNPLNIDFFLLAKKDTICIPNFEIYNHFNDRFCIATYQNGLLYCSLFQYMLAYSKEKPLHSETFHYDMIVQKFNIKLCYVPFTFQRVRANGKIEEKDIDINSKIQNKQLNKFKFKPFTLFKHPARNNVHSIR